MSHGRHARSSPPILLIVALTIALAPALAGGWMLWPGDDAGSSDVAFGSSASSGAAAPWPSTTVAGTSARGGRTDSPTAAEAAWWTGCQHQLTTGDALLSAQRDAATHWGQHVGAQTALDAKRITPAQAKKQWAASKAFGPSDLAASSAAETAYRAAGRSCRTPATAVAESRSEAAEACSTFAAGQARTIGLGRTVVKQWSTHLDMMARKAEINHEEYMTTWTGMVKAAQPPLTALDSAARSLGAAPECGPPAG